MRRITPGLCKPRAASTLATASVVAVMLFGGAGTALAQPAPPERPEPAPQAVERPPRPPGDAAAEDVPFGDETDVGEDETAQPGAETAESEDARPHGRLQRLRSLLRALLAFLEDAAPEGPPAGESPAEEGPAEEAASDDAAEGEAPETDTATQPDPETDTVTEPDPETDTVTSPDPVTDTATESETTTVTGALAGDADLEGGCAWLETGEGSVEVLWPEGYQVTFEPLQLRGPDGEVVAEAGEDVTVHGTFAQDRTSICQVGDMFEASAVSE